MSFKKKANIKSILHNPKSKNSNATEYVPYKRLQRERFRTGIFKKIKKIPKNERRIRRISYVKTTKRSSQKRCIRKNK